MPIVSLDYGAPGRLALSSPIPPQRPGYTCLSLIVVAIPVADLPTDFPRWEGAGVYVHVRRVVLERVYQRVEVASAQMLAGKRKHVGGSDCPGHRSSGARAGLSSCWRGTDTRTEEHHDAARRVNLPEVNVRHDDWGAHMRICQLEFQRLRPPVEPQVECAATVSRNGSGYTPQYSDLTEAGQDSVEFFCLRSHRRCAQHCRNHNSG
jgi:hypothetical protein